MEEGDPTANGTQLQNIGMETAVGRVPQAGPHQGRLPTRERAHPSTENKGEDRHENEGRGPKGARSSKTEERPI